MLNVTEQYKKSLENIDRKYCKHGIIEKILELICKRIEIHFRIPNTFLEILSIIENYWKY